MKVGEILKEAYILDPSNLTVLECGASTSLESDNLRQNKNCYYIEANYDDFKEISTRTENVSHFALTNHNEMVDFFVTSHGGNSSISHSEEHKYELITHHKSTFTKKTVPATTYKNYIENIIKTNIDILILDIEGHETVVLETFRELEVHQLPKIICIECGYDWLARKKILLELGYILDFYEFNNCFFTHSTSNIQKNIDNINKFNKNNKEFIWYDTVIYRNELY
jgi:FkbM family methyltransferase